LRPSLHTIRRAAAVLFGVAGLALLPWTWWISESLPTQHHTRHWDLAWGGFDSALALCFLLTALAAWHRHPWLPAAAAATGALLVCDAWFDIVLENRSSDFEIAVIEALAAEIPAALICFAVAYVTSRAGPQALDQA
jgi:hypothetical protein